MRKYNRSIAATLAAVLCSMSLVAGCGSKPAEAPAQAEPAAVQAEQAEPAAAEAEQTDAAAGEAKQTEAAETEAQQADAAAGQADAAAAEQTDATAGDTSYVLPDDVAYDTQIDLAGCDTFTQIVDKLEAGKGYANAALDGTDVLLVSSSVLDYGEEKTAVDAEVFAYIDGKPQYLGHVQAGGTATPLAAKDGKLYTAGHHFVKKSTVKDGNLVTEELAYETFDKDGNATYHFVSDDNAGVEKTGDGEAFEKLYEEYQGAELIEFTKVE